MFETKKLSRLMLVLLITTIVVWTVGLYAQEVVEPVATEVVDAAVEPVAAAVEPTAAPGDSVPEPTSQTLTMLVTIIVAPMITAVLRRFNVANSLYQSINALASVGIFIAWWYLLGQQVGPVEDWIWRGLGVAAISGAALSVTGRKADLKREFKALGSGSSK